MSKKNILRTEKVNPNKVRVTFDTANGEMTYEYNNSSARAFLRGSEPSQLSGKLVKHEKNPK